MSKIKFDDYTEAIVAAINATYHITSSSISREIIAPWKGLGLHLIFDADDGSDPNLIIRARASALLQRHMLQYYSFFDLQRDIATPTLPTKDVDDRTVTVSKFGATEEQPLDAEIQTLTSPTAKSIDRSTATDTNSRSTVGDTIERAKFLRELDAFSIHIRKVLSPLIEEFSEMY